MGLLCLTRHLNEQVIVTMPDGRRGRIVVVQLRGDKVRLGLDFPRDCEVHRDEVQFEVDRERRRITEDGGPPA